MKNLNGWKIPVLLLTLNKMLPSFIIEQLKKKEQMKQPQPQPVLELPIPEYKEKPKEKSEEGGSVTIELWSNE